jgi:hypothetical protein
MKKIMATIFALTAGPANALSLMPVPPDNEIVNVPCQYRKWDKSVLFADGPGFDKMLAQHGYGVKRGKYGEDIFLVNTKFIRMTKVMEEDNVWKVGMCDFELRKR